PFGDQGDLCWPGTSESAPEWHALQLSKPAIDHESVAQLSRAAIIDLRPDNDRISLGCRYLGERKSQLFRKLRPRDCDKTAIRNVRGHTAAIGVEEHHLHFGSDAWRVGIHRKIDITASTTSGTVTVFMHRKSIGHSRKKHGLHST